MTTPCSDMSCASSSGEYPRRRAAPSSVASNAALDPRFEDAGWTAKAAGSGVSAAVPRQAGRGSGIGRGVVRGALARLAAEMGAENLQGGGSPEGVGSRDEGASRQSCRGQRHYLTCGGIGAWSRVFQDDGRELRAARSGGGCPAEEGARGAERGKVGLVKTASSTRPEEAPIVPESFPNTCKLELAV
jgi:hypothetical protein